MKAKTKLLILILIFSSVLIASFLFLFFNDILVLNPKGAIGEKERDLLTLSTALMLIVVIPVCVLTFWIAWKYRADNQGAKYTPNWDHSLLAECVWWGVPFAIIIALGAINWKACHELDPFKPLNADVKPLKIQVVALRWKWLFIYPEQNIATLSFVQFPENVPIAFEITADAPMNSFWIPQLGGQIYAMPGMRSKLHLIANEAGSFQGSSANLSGKGFSHMTFIANSIPAEAFDQWVNSVRRSSQILGLDEYAKIAEPSESNPQTAYRLRDASLFDQIVMKYMMPIQ
jgi:cytochrome o ubiquinol oxidase subunit 2